jgi:hypothetical protein
MVDQWASVAGECDGRAPFGAENQWAAPLRGDVLKWLLARLPCPIDASHCLQTRVPAVCNSTACRGEFWHVVAQYRAKVHVIAQIQVSPSALYCYGGDVPINGNVIDTIRAVELSKPGARSPGT